MNEPRSGMLAKTLISSPFGTPPQRLPTSIVLTGGVRPPQNLNPIMTATSPSSPPSVPPPPPDQRAELHFRILFEQAPLGILLVEARTGRIIRANHCFARLVGRTPAELERLDWMSITHPEDLPANRLGMEQLNARKIATYHAVKRYLRPDGSAVWTNMTSSRVYANGHDHPQNLTLVEDITAQRKAEQQIQDLTARLEERVRDRTAALEAEVAARRRTEQELMAIQANLEATLAGMNDALFIVDTQGHRNRSRASSS